VEESHSRPFYFHPPWNVLFDLQMLERANPWDIKVSFLLMTFLEEMEKRAEVDFRASGVALDSSATIYLMKSKLLLKLEEPPPVPEPKLDLALPPLILPVRFELTSTTIRNLLDALDRALETMGMFTLRAPLKDVLPPPPEIVPIVSVYLMEVEEQMEVLLRKMRAIAEEGRVILFSKLAWGLEKLEQIRTFIILLFLAHQGRVALWQEENSEEICVTLNGG